MLFFASCALGVLNKESMVPMLIAYPLTEVWIEHRVRWTSIAAVVGLIGGVVCVPTGHADPREYLLPRERGPRRAVTS